jgi:hypothetical protein
MPLRFRLLVTRIFVAAFGWPLDLTAQLRPFTNSRWQWHLTLSDAMATYTASHNESIRDGSLSTVAVQAARPLFTWRGATFSWMSEALPVMRVTSGAPAGRIPTPLTDPAEANSPERLARYTLRTGAGFGLAPLGAEARVPIARRAQVVVNVTAGAAWFNQVVPYGKATQANFTVAPGVALQHDIGARDAFAVGYALHHLSNASMGGANPGMNSHLLLVRWARKR